MNEDSPPAPPSSHSRLYNMSNGFGYISIALHWGMALLIFGTLGLGLYMVRAPEGVNKSPLYGIHKEFGMLILMLAFLRVLWRFRSVIPSLADLPRWEAIAAYLSHMALYFFMLAMPLTGWMLSSRAGYPVSFFGLFVIPTLVGPDAEQRRFFGTIHEYLAYTFIILLALHIGAALKHLLIDKDAIFKRMLIPPPP